MNKKRFDEIIENINKHNVIQSLCGGMTSYDCAISELAEYALELRQVLNKIREKLLEFNDKHKVVSGIPFDVLEIFEMIEIIDDVLGDEK